MADAGWPVIRYWLAVMGFLAAIAWCAVGQAQCYTIEDAPLDADCVVMRWGDARGVWLREERAAQLRNVTAERDELAARASVYDAALEKRAAQVILLRSAAASYRAAIGEERAARGAAVEMASRARREADRARAWWRHPAIWFGAGVVATGAVVTVVALR